MFIWVYTSEVKTNDQSLSVLEYKKYLCYVQMKILYEKYLVCTKKNMYTKDYFVWVYTSDVKTNDRSLSVLEYKRSICIMYRWNFVKSVWQKFWYVQRNIMYIKECYGTYTVKEAHWLKRNFAQKNSSFRTNGFGV